jgi:glutathione synthase
MTIKICAIMDPIADIHVKKDTTVALLLQAQKLHWEIHYLQPKDIFLANHIVHGLTHKMSLRDASENWVAFDKPEPERRPLKDFDIILMRKDPPFDNAYLYTTYLLEIAQKAGCFIVNDPRSIRDANEKLFASWFPQCCPETLVTTNKQLINEFLKKHAAIVVKRLNSMGGDAVFMLDGDNPNFNVTIEVLTERGTLPIMAQRFIPEIVNGDKRILMIDGKPYPYALSRVPARGDFRGNLASGATAVGAKLTARDQWLCEQIGETLRKKNLFFVGVDVIGDFITEINVTSPTCVREIEHAFQINICAEILQQLELKLKPYKL